eukprot:Nitzschia sp. Nitz4//scaffold74_size92883//53864//58924//NITZ4_004827-RA/size92883-augustus-gene-0.6-mRNA-1//1//CDS//3329557607//8622//frame0
MSTAWLSDFCSHHSATFEPQDGGFVGHEYFWERLNLTRVHPWCDHVDEFTWMEGVPPMGPLDNRFSDGSIMERGVALWYMLAPPLLAMAELWLRLLAGILSPLGCLYMMMCLLSASRQPQSKTFLGGVCILTMSSSLVLMTDTYYVLDLGPAFGIAMFLLSILLSLATVRAYRLYTVVSVVLWSLVLLSVVLVVDSDGKGFHFGDPTQEILNVSEGLYYNGGNPMIRTLVDNWPEQFRTYTYAQGATPWMRTGDARTGLPFLLHHNFVKPHWHEVFLPTLDDEEWVGLHVALPKPEATDEVYLPPIGGGSTSKPSKPMYLLLHGLNGGSDEEYIRDFTLRRVEEGSIVVVMIARGLMDFPVRGWNIFHGARTIDAHAAALALRRTLKPDQSLIGVGYSMGAIVLSNYVSSYGSECALDGAITISGGLDMRYQEHFVRAQRLWQPMLAETLRNQFLLGKWGHRVEARLSQDDIIGMLRATHVTDIDRHAVVPYHGFRDLNDYYTTMSALGDIPYNDKGLPEEENSGKIHSVSIPLCVVQAMDDPLISWRATAQNEGFMHPSNLVQSGTGNVMILLTKAGGHVGWPMGWNSPSQKWCWMSDVAKSFGDAVAAAARTHSDPSNKEPATFFTTAKKYAEERDAPWNAGTSQQKRRAKRAKETPEIVKIVDSLSVPKPSLDRLEEELQNFARYVKLTDQEKKIRTNFIKKIQNLCKATFEIDPTRCKVFGSFAAPDVCIFSSDVDLVMHGVIPWSDLPANHHDQQEEVVQPIQKKQAMPEIDDAPVTLDTDEGDNLKLKRHERVLRWKSLLDEVHTEKVIDLTESSESEPVASIGKPSVATEEVKMSAAISETIVDRGTLESNEKQNAKESSISVTGITCPQPLHITEISTSEPLPNDSERGDNGLPLFTIDCAGVMDLDKSRDTMGTPPAVTDTSNESSVQGDAIETEMDVPWLARSASRNETELSPANDEESVSPPSDSSTDSADKMEGMKFQKQVQVDDEETLLQTRPRGHSVISLCSATTCSEGDQKELDESGMEVSFVAPTTPKASNLPLQEQSEEQRKLVIRALNSLSRRIRKKCLAQQVTVRKWARVPIINMATEAGFECDITVAGFNGTDTSSFANFQCQRFKSFSTVVVLLKVLLEQHDLDKPFTGGLGSFRLYVLVAHHIEKHLQLGGNDSAAEVLLMFLYRYGLADPNTDPDSDHLKTPLEVNQKVRNSGDQHGEGASVAELNGVNTELCVHMFRLCFHKLHDQLYGNEARVLHHIIDATKLKAQRGTPPSHSPKRERFQVAKTTEESWPMIEFEEHAGSWSRGRGNGRAQKRRTDGEFPPDSDEEANLLMESYGVKTGKKSDKKQSGKKQRRSVRK